jgi:hypothetical protein
MRAVLAFLISFAIVAIACVGCAGTDDGTGDGTGDGKGDGDGASPDASIPSTPTPDAPPTPSSLTYAAQIKPVMDGLCNGCHGGGSAPQNYFTSSYQGLLGTGSDSTPNIIPGNANSKFVSYVQSNHHNVLAKFPGFDSIAHDWVVRDGAAQ